jgi:hypothetical protein
LFGTLQSPPLTFDSFPTTDFTASDTDQTAPGFTTLNPGDVFGLAHVSYEVASGTSAGAVTVSLVPDGTSLSDVTGSGIVFTPVGGSITINASTPEPSSLTMIGIGTAALLMHRYGRSAGALARFASRRSGRFAL